MGTWAAAEQNRWLEYEVRNFKTEELEYDDNDIY